MEEAYLAKEIGKIKEHMGKYLEKKESEMCLSVDENVLADQEKKRGNEEYRQNHFAEAIERYEEAIKINPSNTTYYGNITIVLFQQRKFEDCMLWCEKAIEVGMHNDASASCL